jgi:hypothetical protein
VDYRGRTSSDDLRGCDLWDVVVLDALCRVDGISVVARAAGVGLGWAHTRETDWLERG